MLNVPKRKIGRLTNFTNYTKLTEFTNFTYTTYNNTYKTKNNFEQVDYLKNFNKFSKKTFFLKYMQKKGIIPDPNAKPQPISEIKKSEGLNLKELLDEKNIQISFSDILRDYKYFKREYYSVDLNPPPKQSNLPFDKKDISFKKVFHYYFVQDKVGNILRTALVLLAFNVIFFIAEWRMKRLEKLNEQILMKLDDTNEDKLERTKHQNIKWANYE